MFQDSGEHEMGENFLSLVLENIEDKLPLDGSTLDPQIEEYIAWGMGGEKGI